jgi:hypothetical protein
MSKAVKMGKAKTGHSGLPRTDGANRKTKIELETTKNKKSRLGNRAKGFSPAPYWPRVDLTGILSGKMEFLQHMEQGR